VTLERVDSRVISLRKLITEVNSIAKATRTWTVSFPGCRICSGSGSTCVSGCVRVQNMTGINETRRHETLVAVTMSQHPEPIRIIAIQHRDEFASLDADVVLVPRHKRVEDNVSASRWILKNVQRLRYRILDNARIRA